METRTQTDHQEASARTRKPGEHLFVALLLLVSILAFFLSYGISGFASISAPGTLPLLASSVLVASALTINREVWSLPSPPPDQSFAHMLTPAVLINFFALGLIYIAILTLLGFIPATFTYLFVATLYLHRQGWLLAFFVSLNSLAIIYIVFRLIFKVILPEGVLES